MDFNATIDLIIKDLDAAREIIDDLKKYPGVPVLQVELAKSKCKSAGEVIALLKDIQSSVHATEKHEILIEKPVEKISTAKKSTPEVKPASKKPTLVPEKNIPDKPEKESADLIMIADTFTHPVDSFYDRLGALKSDEDLSEKMKTKPISDLTDAIGVNDKFLFIREIFNGNKEAYSQAISRLNSAENMTDAIAVIMSYTGENPENEAVNQLLELVKRKFPSDE
jgi:hypothetical protein